MAKRSPKQHAKRLLASVEGLPLFSHKPAKTKAKAKPHRHGCATVHVKAHDRVVCRGARGRFVKSK